MCSFFPLPESSCMVCWLVKKLGACNLKPYVSKRCCFWGGTEESELLGGVGVWGGVRGLLLWDPKWVDKEAALGRGQAMNAVNHPPSHLFAFIPPLLNISAIHSARGWIRRRQIVVKESGNSNHGTGVKPPTERLRLYLQMLLSKCKQRMLVKSHLLYRHFVPLGTDFSYFIHNFRLF
jgi:hypothetical protein